MSYYPVQRINIDTDVSGAAGNVPEGAIAIYVANVGNTPAIFDNTELIPGVNHLLNLEPLGPQRYPAMAYNAQASRLLIKIFI
jgi:hypothetical protein